MMLVEGEMGTDKAVIVFSSSAVGRSGCSDVVTDPKPAVAVKVSQG